MTMLEHVPVAAMDPHRFESVIPTGEYQQLLDLIEGAASELHGRVV